MNYRAVVMATGLVFTLIGITAISQYFIDPVGLEKYSSRTTGMEFRLLPPGTFLAGSPKTEVGRDNYWDDEDQHKVEISEPFYMGVYEVTQRQWYEVMGTKPWRDRRGVKPSIMEGNDYPAACVTWEQAKEFCTKLSEREGRVYRLPTEAEWEYACRAGTTSRFSFGDSAEALDNYAWFAGNALNVVHRVGQKWANPFGLYDMHGNVAEWCADRYYPDYDKQTTDHDPKKQSGHGLRVVRGGSYGATASSCRSAARQGVEPTSGASMWGFRVVLEPN